MAWALILSLAVAMSTGTAPAKTPVSSSAPALGFTPARKPRLVRVSSTDQFQPSPSYDPEAEQQLLALANQARVEAGVPPLQMDQGLTQAARAHAAEMVAEQQLSHQFPGESSLTQRIAAESALHLDRAGENVAYGNSVERVQDIFMHSPPHRENLLNAGFNVAGFGVVRNGDNLYVTQDFGHNLPAYSSTQADAVVRAAVESRRAADRLSQLQALDGSSARQAACAMAQSNALNAQAPQARYILRYTAETPGQLPSNASRAIDDPAIRAYAVGSCFARTASYPSGAYWVLLLFY